MYVYLSASMASPFVWTPRIMVIFVRTRALPYWFIDANLQLREMVPQSAFTHFGSERN
jgi:hypothetical protein